MRGNPEHVRLPTHLHRGGDSSYYVRTHADIAKLRPRSSTCANSFQGTPGTPGARITPRLFFLLRGASFFVRVPPASSMATAGGGGRGGGVCQVKHAAQ